MKGDFGNRRIRKITNTLILTGVSTDITSKHAVVLEATDDYENTTPQSFDINVNTPLAIDDLIFYKL